MLDETPFLFFRRRDNGATVLRVSSGAHGRMEMDHVANANTRNGEIKLIGDATLSDDETGEITQWITAQQDADRRDHVAQLAKVSDEINRLAHWVQTKARPGDVAADADRLLMSMHDLRQVLLRKMADGSKGDSGSN